MRSILSIPKRFKGNFEQHNIIPPRYFLLTYRLGNQEIDKKVIDDHADKVQQAVSAQSVIFRAQTEDKNQIMMVFNSRDEREPHSFLKFDPIYQAGLVAEWNIEELGLTHKTRDDELVIRGKYS